MTFWLRLAFLSLFLLLLPVSSFAENKAPESSPASATPKETPQLVSLLKQKAHVRGPKERLVPAYVSVKQGWAYLIGSIEVMVDGDWEYPNDGGVAALYRQVKGTWTILEWVQYGPDENQTGPFEKKIRQRQQTDHLPDGLLPKGSLVWGEE